MKRINVILLATITLGYILASCGPTCKECQIDSELGISVSMGELCDEKLKEAEKMDGVSCR